MSNMNEYAIYEYVRNVVMSIDKTFKRPITKDLIIHLVGGYGLDILENAKLITPMENPNCYVLSCEEKGENQ